MSDIGLTHVALPVRSLAASVPFYAKYASTVPPSRFALLVAEAVGDLSPTSEWKALTGPNVDEPVREAMRQSYAETVLPKFVRRYGFSWPREEERRMIRWL